MTTIPNTTRPLTVTQLEALCKEHDLQGAVTITIGKDGVVTTTSWADAPDKCLNLGEWAQGLAANGITIWPFCTHFGWGLNAPMWDRKESIRKVIAGLQGELDP